MAVDVKRKRGCGVSEISLHGLDVVAGLKRGNGIAMPQIMQSGMGETNRLDDLFVL